MSVMYTDDLVTSFKPHMHTYTDVDACATHTHNCDVNAVCTNTHDGFSCACKTGFSGDGTTCTSTADAAGGRHLSVRMT